MKIVIIGGGKMGLPLACQMAAHGAFVTVCDIKSEVVTKINSGILPFLEPGLYELMKMNLETGRLKADTNTSLSVSDAQAVIVIVPAVLTDDKEINYNNLAAASEAISLGMKPGTLVSYETTVPVGGCRSVLIPILEKNSLKAGKDFYVCFSPERVKSLHIFDHLTKIPKIIGGFDTISAEKAVELYGRYLGAPVINVGSLEAAEFVKLAGMIYRDVNIALANELAAYSEAVGLDIYQIIEAANTDGEASLLQPGIGVGGHCTPVYPYFLTRQAARLGIPQQLAERGRFINEEQPHRNIERIASALGSLQGKTVHILGIAFRPDVKEHICSPAFALRDELIKQGAVVTAEDPLYSDDEIQRLGFTPAKVGKETIHAAILNTAHSVFKKQNFAQWRDVCVQAVLDGRNFWSQDAVEQAGLIYLCVGKPSSKQ